MNKGVDFVKIAFGSDHAGLALKNQLIEYLENAGHEILDFGTYTNDSCDYPDYACAAAMSVVEGNADYAIVVCYTGIGVSIAANKVKGIRCSLVGNVEDAVLTKEHNDSNCLALGSKNTPYPLAKDIVDAWLTASFIGGRHLNRINKIRIIEEK